MSAGFRILTSRAHSVSWLSDQGGQGTGPRLTVVQSRHLQRGHLNHTASLYLTQKETLLTKIHVSLSISFYVDVKHSFGDIVMIIL